MPNNLYPMSTSSPTHGKGTYRSSPPAGLRLRTWWQRERLDAALADGADPSTSAELSRRAEQLCSPSERVRTAENLERVLHEALQPATIGHLLLRRRQAQACADELLALANRLRDDQPIDLCGVAMTAILLTNGRGPLYYERANVPLRQAARSARLALDRGTTKPLAAVLQTAHLRAGPKGAERTPMTSRGACPHSEPF